MVVSYYRSITGYTLNSLNTIASTDQENGLPVLQSTFPIPESDYIYFACTFLSFKSMSYSRKARSQSYKADSHTAFRFSMPQIAFPVSQTKHM